MHNLISHNQLQYTKHSADSLPDITRDAMSEYFECIVDYSPHPHARAMCKHILE